MTSEEIIDYAKKLGIDNAEEILSKNPIDANSLRLFEEAMLMDKLADTINNNKRIERPLLALVNHWLLEGDIDGKFIDQSNLDRLNKANVLALLFFKNAKSIEFEPPANNRSFAQTFVRCEDFVIEDEKAKNRSLFNQLLETVDEFNVTTTANRTLLISIAVNDIWRE